MFQYVLVLLEVVELNRCREGAKGYHRFLIIDGDFAVVNNIIDNGTWYYGQVSNS